MKNTLRSLLCLLSIISFLVPSISAFAQQQRPRRATGSIELQQQLPSGTRILPRGHILILRIETPLDSGKNRPGDRFYARLNDVLTDEENRMLIPANTLFTGHVADVAPAQMRRRSGVIEIVFDKMLTADGRELPVKGILTSVDGNERKRLKIYEEGVIEGGKVICPWHGWAWDPKTGEAQVPGAKIAVYPVKVEGGDVLIEVG